MTDFGIVAGISSFLSSLGPKIEGLYQREHEIAALRSFFRNLGFSIVGEGSYRLALKHPTCPDVVFKFAFLAERDGGYYMTSRDMGTDEHHFWNTAIPNFRKRLAEVYHSLPYVCVMEFIEKDKSGLDDTLPCSIMEDLKLNWELWGQAMADDTHSNYIVCKKRGHRILIDYTPEIF